MRITENTPATITMHDEVIVSLIVSDNGNITKKNFIKSPFCFFAAINIKGEHTKQSRAFDKKEKLFMFIKAPESDLILLYLDRVEHAMAICLFINRQQKA